MPADQSDHETRVAALTARIAEAFDMPVDLLKMDHWHALEAAQRREFAASLRATADQLDPPDTDRQQHHVDLEQMDAADVVGTDTLTVMAVLRDIADAEPIYRVDGSDGSTYDENAWVRCAACRSSYIGARGPGWGGPYPFPHLISCPWVRVTHIVGVKAETAPAVAGSPRYPDVEVSTDAGRTWSPFPLAPLASLRLTVSDGQVHDDGRGHLYRAVGSDGDPSSPTVHRSVPKGGPGHG